MKLGIDIGGTTIKGALIEGDREIVAERSVPTHGAEGREAIFSSLFSLIDSLMSDEVSFLGISSAGNIDPDRGICVYATDNLMGWTGADLAGELGRRYRLPCRADNDAVCALKGELLFCPEAKDVTMLTFGTGVGGASLVGGSIVRGKDFGAGRWGHVILEPHGRRCSCGRQGCAESYLSATALLKRGRELIPSLESCRELFLLCSAGNREAERVIEEFGQYLDLLLCDIRTALSPEKIILGGGVMGSREIVLEHITDASDIAFAKLGNHAGVIGACL